MRWKRWKRWKTHKNYKNYSNYNKIINCWALRLKAGVSASRVRYWTHWHCFRSRLQLSMESMRSARRLLQWYKYQSFKYKLSMRVQYFSSEANEHRMRTECSQYCRCCYSYNVRGYTILHWRRLACIGVHWRALSVLHDRHRHTLAYTGTLCATHWRTTP